MIYLVSQRTEKLMKYKKIRKRKVNVTVPKQFKTPEF